MIFKFTPQISQNTIHIHSIPGDKSISHRAIIIPSISQGVSEISNLLMSEDVIHTLNAFKEMGVSIENNVFM